MLSWAIGFLIAFYYLLRVGEYTQKNSRQETKQTVEFMMRNVSFFGKTGPGGALRRLNTKTASDEDILAAAGAALLLENQQNGWRNVSIFHFANDHEVTCPVKALARRYIHIRAHSSKPTEKLSAYFVNNKKFYLRDKDVSAALKAAAIKLDYEFTRGIPDSAIDTHSLRAGGANALHLSGYSDRVIQKMGRWTSNTFKEYIRENISIFSEGLSKGMATPFQFVNVHAGAVKDVTEATVEAPYHASAA